MFLFLTWEILKLHNKYYLHTNLIIGYYLDDGIGMLGWREKFCKRKIYSKKFLIPKKELGSIYLQVQQHEVLIACCVFRQFKRATIVCCTGCYVNAAQLFLTDRFWLLVHISDGNSNKIKITLILNLQ